MRYQVKILLSVTLMIFLYACGMVKENRIRESVLSDSNLPSHIREAIQQKQIMVGMTKQQVIASWGEPCWWCYGTRQSSVGDTWEYNVFGSSVYGAGSGAYLYFDNNNILKYWSK